MDQAFNGKGVGEAGFEAAIADHVDAMAASGINNAVNFGGLAFYIQCPAGEREVMGSICCCGWEGSGHGKARKAVASREKTSAGQPAAGITPNLLATHGFTSPNCFQPLTLRQASPDIPDRGIVEFWEMPVKNVMTTSIKKYFGSAEGSAAVEYVVIAAALTTALIPGFYYVSSAVADKMIYITSFFFGT